MLKDLRVHKVRKVYRGLQDFKVRRVPRARKAQLLQVALVPQVQQDRQV